MIAPLPLDFADGTGPSLAAALGVGIAFGWCLERAGLGSAPKLMGQFTLRCMRRFWLRARVCIAAPRLSMWTMSARSARAGGSTNRTLSQRVKPATSARRTRCSTGGSPTVSFTVSWLRRRWLPNTRA